jgi:hypothetical protein
LIALGHVRVANISFNQIKESFLCRSGTDTLLILRWQKVKTRRSYDAKSNARAVSSLKRDQRSNVKREKPRGCVQQNARDGVLAHKYVNCGLALAVGPKGEVEVGMHAKILVAPEHISGCIGLVAGGTASSHFAQLLMVPKIFSPLYQARAFMVCNK